VELVRGRVPPLETDRPLSEDIELVAGMIAGGEIAALV
jgi:histidine ammonia-lyase